MSFAAGDRVRPRTGGAVMTVVRLLEDGDVECCRPAEPDGGATGLVSRHPAAALQPMDGAAPQGDPAGVRAETEPSDKNLGPKPPRGLPPDR